MRKTTKILLIVGTSLIILGSIIFVIIGFYVNWDLSKVGTRKFETNTYDVSEEFKNISINTETADIIFEVSTDNKTQVVCYEEEHMKHQVSVEEGELKVNLVDTRKWYEHIGFVFTSPKITVYIPQGEYGNLAITSDTGDVKITKNFKFAGIIVLGDTGNVTNYASSTGLVKVTTDTGDIYIENISAGSLDLTVSTGKVNVLDVNCEGDVKIDESTGKAYLTNVVCKNVISSGSTGDITLMNAIASEMFSIKRSTGDVNFDRCDAAEIMVETDTGDVEGSLLTTKVFITRTDTGNINVPSSIVGGRCEITTDTGDIKIEVIN